MIYAKRVSYQTFRQAKPSQKNKKKNKKGEANKPKTTTLIYRHFH